MRNINIFVYFLCLLIVFTVQHKCIHDEIQSQVNVIESKFNKKRILIGINDVTPQPIRIHFDTSQIEKLSSSYKKFIERQLLPVAQKFFEKRLKVRRANSPIKFNGESCYKVTPPISHKTQGIDADLVIYITASYDYYSVAWAIACQTDSNLNGRPTFGQINISLYYLDLELHRFDSNIGTILHEVTHVLGFSRYRYSSFVDGNGVKRNKTTVYSNSKYYLVTPKLVEVAREHFKCSNLSGVQLEDQGGGGSAGSHFERKLLYNEVMTATDIQVAPFSKFTMGLLEDSGWYVPNYDLAEAFYFGEDEGCDFISKGCIGTNFREYCNNQSYYGCSYSYHSKAYCTRYFANDCYYYMAYSNGNCDNIYQNTKNSYGELYGLKSKCFKSNLYTSSFYTVSVAGRCYEYSCNDNHTEITIKLHNKETKNCSIENEKVNFTSFTGYVLCPNPKIFCKDYYPFCPDFCSGYGNCINGKCECNHGRTGSSCSQIDSCPIDCGKHGVCGEKNLTCNCDKDWTGEKCNIPKKKCPNMCSQRGTCIDGKCYCYYGYYRDDCSKVNCSIGYYRDDCSKLNCSIVGCNDREICNTYNYSCICNKNWTGEKCNIPINNCPNKCSQRGTCINGKCYCYYGYYGDDCSKLNCSIVGCNDREICNTYNYSCICNKNWTGEKCNIPINNCPNKCSQRGTCINGKCYCYYGYYGDDCSKLNCSIVGCNDREICNTYNYSCICNKNWTGEKCNIPINNCPNKCSQLGTCINGKCYCYYGYYGDDCSKLNCSIVGCNDREICNTYNYSCICNKNWTGEKCNIQKKKNVHMIVYNMEHVLMVNVIVIMDTMDIIVFL